MLSREGNQVPQISPQSRSDDVRHMFSRIANHYDRANRWMTWGQDVKWRREVLRLAQLPAGGSLLDVGSGTGDLASNALQFDHPGFIVAADFTTEMIQVGRSRQGGGSICWVNADAMRLPFPPGSFDAVVSGYLLRNVVDLGRTLAEQYRLLKWGGRMVNLDTSPPPGDLWHLPTRLYLRHVIPMIGRLVSGESDAYSYLSQTTERFASADNLAVEMEKVGFREVKYRRFMGGSMAIHWGVKLPGQ